MTTNQTTDIVQTLRDVYSSHPIIMQAADEIERLREELEMMVDQRRIEIDAMREAPCG